MLVITFICGVENLCLGCKRFTLNRYAKNAWTFGTQTLQRMFRGGAKTQEYFMQQMHRQQCAYVAELYPVFRTF